MYLLNLSLAEFLTLFVAASGAVTVLYLLDRSRRTQVVATLRFWTQADKPTEARRRRRIRQPVSLLLQLLAIGLLLLALAQLRWGRPEEASRDHVLLLDTSAWMMARSAQGTLMDEARSLALEYSKAVPAEDRLMLVRAEAFASPVTAFETDRKLLERAILDSRPGSGALHLDEALHFSRSVQSLHGRRPGEIVYVGCGRVAETDTAFPDVPNLRVLAVKAPPENVGIRKVGLRHSPSEADLWEVYVSVRNYSAAPRTVDLAIQFAGSPAGARVLELGPQSEAEATIPLRTRAAGVVEARVFPSDQLPEDNQAVLELPARHAIKVAVYSDRPELLRPFFQATPFVEVDYRRPGSFTEETEARIVVFDRFHPAGTVNSSAIWIEPPPGRSPVALRTPVSGVTVREWLADHPLSAGLRTQDLVLRSAMVFAPAEGYEAVASVAQGPVLLAGSAQGRKSVVLGFHPMGSSTRYELASPLLFANILRWLEPGLFRNWELNAGSVGAVEVALESGADVSAVRVSTAEGRLLPATFHAGTLRFFSASPGVVRVVSGDRELVYSLTLPDVAPALWEPPSAGARGVPAQYARSASFRDIWWWLAAGGAILLAVEWLRYGRFRKWSGTPGMAGRVMALPRSWRSKVSSFLRRAS